MGVGLKRSQTMKQNYWFRLDCDFLSDAKIQDIHFAYGNDAIVAYIVAVIRLYKGGGKVERSKYKQIAYEAHTGEEVVKHIVEESGLFVIEGDVFYSNRVLQEMEAQKEISAKRAEAGKSGARQRLANAQANAMANAQANDEQKPKQNPSKTQANYQLPITNYNSNLDSSLRSESCPTSEKSDSGTMFPEEKKDDDESGVLTSKQCQQVVDFWNRTVERTKSLLPTVKSLSDERKNKIRIRWREFAEVGESIEVCKTLFTKACESKFLQGDNPKGWHAGFDWVFSNGKNWLKIYEGNYDDRRGAPAQRTRTDKYEDALSQINQIIGGEYEINADMADEQ